MSRILVVDDDAAVRAVLQLVLTRAGHHVAAAADGAEALEWLRREACDLAIIDVDMPGMNGFAVCEAIRAQAALAHVRLVMITGRPVDGVPHRAREVGAIDLLAKPFRREELLHKMAIYLEGGAAPP